MYYWLSVCATQLNIQPSEFWKMPFFTVVQMAQRVNPPKPSMSRKQMVDGLREVKKRRGWK